MSDRTSENMRKDGNAASAKIGVSPFACRAYKYIKSCANEIFVELHIRYTLKSETNTTSAIKLTKCLTL